MIKTLKVIIMNPILINIPMPITTPRLLIRPAQSSHSGILNRAIVESFNELKKFMAWANYIPSLEETTIELKKAEVRWILREDLMLLIFDKQTNDFLGATGFHRIDWKLPKFEIGYWVRSSESGKGIITESTNALTYYAFKELKAVRVEIKCSENNIGSRRIAEKLNFNLEGILYNDYRENDKSLRNTIVYACTDIEKLPRLNISW